MTLYDLLGLAPPMLDGSVPEFARGWRYAKNWLGDMIAGEAPLPLILKSARSECSFHPANAFEVGYQAFSRKVVEAIEQANTPEG